MEKVIIIYLVLINIIGFLSMYIDKKKSVNHKWRISEKALILIAILGGAVGSLIGMRSFRHKTKHLKFTLGIPFIIIIEAFLLYILLTQFK